MNTNTQVQATTQKPERGVIEYKPFGSDLPIRLTVKIVQDFLCIPTRSGKICSERDAMKFAMLCQSRALNPWEGDAYLQGYETKNGPEFSLITAHQAFLKRAELHPEFNGFESGVVVAEEDGTVKDIPGDFYSEGQVVLGGWCRVKFKTREEPMYKRLRLATFNKGHGQWTQNPEGMIVKCAEADCLRAAFPTKCGGLFLAGEMQPAPPGTEAAFAAAKPVSVEMPETSTRPVETATRPQENATRPEPAPTDDGTEAAPAPAPAPDPAPAPTAPTAPVENQTPQQKLMAFVSKPENDGGYTWNELHAFLLDSGHLVEPVPSLDALPVKVAQRMLNAPVGLLRGLKAALEQRGGVRL